MAVYVCVQHWMEAVQRMPLILNNIYSMLPPGPHDWCPLADKDGSVYYCR